MILQFLIALAQWIANLFTGGIAWLVGGIQVPVVPVWIASAAVSLGRLMGPAAKLGYWVPWSLVVGVAGTFVVCLIAAVVIQVVRIVASFFTLGGGAT